MVKNYYLILGVPADAAPGAIRSAFRELAKRHHPDHVGPAGSRAFREASEAYRVLSDPVRRARYDRKLQREGRRETEPAAGWEGVPEPLVSDPMPITGEPDLVRPSFESLFERLAGSFSAGGRSKGEAAEPLDFELILSPEEADRGVVVPFQVPVFFICFRCRGSGRDWLFHCPDCGGEGRLVDHRTVEARVPSGIGDGTVIEVSLDRLGIANLWLRVHVRIARH